MAESDRHRLRELALALPHALASDFVKVRPPAGADPAHLRRIDDTSLRTRLIDARVAEGLQSPKGPQRIASIVRIYPDFDAPLRSAPNGARRSPPSPAPLSGRLPSVEDMESLLSRIREVEREVGHELATRIEERIARLKTSLASLEGDALESAHAELGEAFEERRAMRASVRTETFRRIEADADFAGRSFLRFLRRS